MKFLEHGLSRRFAMLTSHSLSDWSNSTTSLAELHRRWRVVAIAEGDLPAAGREQKN